MRSVRLILIAALAFVALLLPSRASADGITWTLDDVNLVYGNSAIPAGTVTGTFNYDAGTNIYSAVNVTSTPGAVFAGTAYTTVTDNNTVFATPTVVGLGPNPFLDFNGGNLTGATLLELIFTNPLTNSGGTDTVFAVEFLCNDSACSDPFTRTSSTGTVTGVPISTPEPASLLLLASGLLGHFLFRLRA